MYKKGGATLYPPWSGKLGLLPLFVTQRFLGEEEIEESHRTLFYQWMLTESTIVAMRGSSFCRSFARTEKRSVMTVLSPVPK